MGDRVEPVTEQVQPPTGDARAEKDMRGISRCWQNFGWHVYAAGPCFDTYEQAIRYRESLDAEGVTWRRQS